jgi:hypothetical protein
MTTKARQIIKDVIQENAVECKKNTTKALYEKVGKALQSRYVSMSSKLFEVAGAEQPEPQAAGHAGVSSVQYQNRDYAIPTPPVPKGASAQWATQWHWLHRNWNNQELWNSMNRTPEEVQRFLLSQLAESVNSPEFLNTLFEDMAVAGIAGDSDQPEMSRFGGVEALRPSDKAPVQTGSDGPTPPPPPSGAPPLWVNRWNYVFQNWNNPNAWQGNGSSSSPGAYLGWLLGQWGNPNFGNWG